MSHTESDLVRAARELRERIGDKQAGESVALDARDAQALRDLLHAAAKVIAGMADRAKEREARISRLESSTGHLMVDRDRTQQQAAIEVAAARELVVKHLGIESPELDMRLREQAEFDQRSLTLLDRERMAYDEFRATVVTLMHEIGDRESLDAETLTKLKSLIDRANKRAMGR